MSKALIPILVVALIAGGLFAGLSSCGESKNENGDLRSCYVSTGGGELGGYTQISLTRDEKAVPS